ncbi:hypothetical protein AAFF_G00112980 [Aldrovandia affinis]|uniref:Uncharacterized protein n=1 Tax=Aldrovandia affinis TaxID=143900 RepID=A0AAD7RT04_9TELE|nr:hypothetical protein AAFF_G00112980 [Aldrovandia affinis]
MERCSQGRLKPHLLSCHKVCCAQHPSLPRAPREQPPTEARCTILLALPPNPQPRDQTDPNRPINKLTAGIVRMQRDAMFGTPERLECAKI